MQTPIPFAALVGIDWADRKHDTCLCAADSTERERSVIAHTPAAIDLFVVQSHDFSFSGFRAPSAIKAYRIMV